MNARGTETTDTRRRGCSWGLLIALVLIAATVAVAIWAIRATDSSPPDDADLMPAARRVVPDDQNAYVAVQYALTALGDASDATNEAARQLRELLAHPEDRRGNVELPDEPTLLALVSRLLTSNGEAIEALAAASQLPHWQGPDGFSHSISYRFTVASLFRLWFWEARSRNDYDEAGRCALTLIRLGQLGCRTPTFQLEVLYFIALARLGMEQACQLLDQPVESTRDLAEIEALISRPAVFPVDWLEACRWDYALWADQLDEPDPRSIFGHDRATHYNFKRNATRHILASKYRLMLAALQGDVQAATELARSGRTERGALLAKARHYFAANELGEQLTQLTTLSLASHQRRLNNAEADVATTRTLIALRRFVDKHGALPEGLNALVPEFLSAVPLDPWDGRPLRYSPKNRVVYSIGDDETDDGGMEELADQIARIVFP